MRRDAPYVAVIGGPNGAGKTTAASAILQRVVGSSVFLNADEIAREMRPDDPAAGAREAGQRMLSQLDRLREARASFALEATLAGRIWAHHIQKLKAAGYEVGLYYFWLPSSDDAVKRVALRVAAGGHDVPEADVRRRYARSVSNFIHLYRPIVSTWSVYHAAPDLGPDAQFPTAPPLIARGEGAETRDVADPHAWRKLLKQAGLVVREEELPYG